MAVDALDLVAIPGSLREGSYNRALATTLPDLLPEHARLEVFELHDVPLYNADMDDDHRPVPAQELRERIDRSDGLILVSPEYNHGIPGVLKNALDWASRPAFRSPMAGKPTGLMGASPGGSGTMRGQQHLKVVLLGMAAQVFPHPGVAVSRARQKFADGVLTDEDTRAFVRDYLASYVTWVRRVGEPRED